MVIRASIYGYAMSYDMTGNIFLAGCRDAQNGNPDFHIIMVDTEWHTHMAKDDRCRWIRLCL